VVALTYRRRSTSRNVSSFPGGRRACRPDAEALQSGETDYEGGVSKCGDALLRTMLYGRHMHCSLAAGNVVAEAWACKWPATRDASSDRRGRQAPGRGSAPDVGRTVASSAGQEGKHSGSYGCLEAAAEKEENRHQGDNAFSSAEKMSSRTRVG